MRYISDKNGNWIPVGKKEKARKGPMIWDDLKDYKPVAGQEAEAFLKRSKDARYISGRKQHREYLKRNGLQEIGNEIKPFLRNGGKTDDNPTKGWIKHGTNGNWDRPSLERLMRGR